MKQTIVRIFAIFALALVALGLVSVGASGQASAHTLQKQVTTQASMPTYCSTTHTYYYWWGTVSYIPDCTIRTLMGYQTQFAITLATAWIAGPYGAILAGALVYGINNAADLSSHCGYGGVYSVRYWTGTTFLSPICSYR